MVETQKSLDQILLDQTGNLATHPPLGARDELDGWCYLNHVWSRISWYPQMTQSNSIKC